MHQISPEQLIKALSSSATHLENNHHILNRLNVFPVPDGDTGSNMFQSMKAAVVSLEKKTPKTLKEIAEIFCDELNKHSRGNSGFIIARFFTGFFSQLQGDAIYSRDLIEGFARGAFTVNTSLFSPREGTMITIIAAITESLAQSEEETLTERLQNSANHGRIALMETPKQLPILARAGVIDSGALGFIILLDGFIGGLIGKPLPTEIEADYRFPPTPQAIKEKEEANYRYCTEAVVRKVQDNIDENLQAYLKDRGNSIALVNDKDILKVHIHTNEPEELITHLKQYGELIHSKIEDMQDQMSLFNKEDNITDNVVLALIPGPGFKDIYNTLGAQYCLSFKETLPSADEIKNRILSIEDDHIIILTNNKNTIPAAMIAQEEVDKTVSILPTEDVIQGIAAMYGFSENDTLADNAKNMVDCIQYINSFAVYQCEEDTQFGDTLIKTGDHFVIYNGAILEIDKEIDTVIKKSFDHFELSSKTNITFYKGDGFIEKNLQEVISHLQKLNPELEMEEFFGGQSRNIILISLE